MWRQSLYGVMHDVDCQGQRTISVYRSFCNAFVYANCTFSETASFLFRDYESSEQAILCAKEWCYNRLNPQKIEPELLAQLKALDCKRIFKVWQEGW